MKGPHELPRASLVAQMVKNLLQCRRPGFDPRVGKVPCRWIVAACSSILARRIPWSEEPGGLQSIESQRVGHNRATNTFTFTPLCYGNPAVWTPFFCKPQLFPHDSPSPTYCHLTGSLEQQSHQLKISQDLPSIQVDYLTISGPFCLLEPIIN